jgi:hypothetical protein
MTENYLKDNFKLNSKIVQAYSVAVVESTDAPLSLLGGY